MYIHSLMNVRIEHGHLTHEQLNLEAAQLGLNVRDRNSADL